MSVFISKIHANGHRSVMVQASIRLHWLAFEKRLAGDALYRDIDKLFPEIESLVVATRKLSDRMRRYMIARIRIEGYAQPTDRDTCKSFKARKPRKFKDHMKSWWTLLYHD